MYLLVIFMICMVDVSHGVSSVAIYTLRSPGVSLNCISISSRSRIECALRASAVGLYGDQFAYRDGQCHVCRANNANCAVSEDGYLLAGPHHVRGRFIVCFVFPRRYYEFHGLTITQPQHGLVITCPKKVWDEISYPLPNFNACTIEVWI